MMTCNILMFVGAAAVGAGVLLIIVLVGLFVTLEIISADYE
jgi:hypothetical protein